MAADVCCVVLQSQLFTSMNACISAADPAVIDAAAEAFEVLLGEITQHTHLQADIIVL